MHAASDVLLLVVILGVVAAAARRLHWSEPLALVVVGVGVSFIPHVLEIRLTPDLVLIGLLPPLLYAAAIRTSLVDFRANRRAIALLSVGLVAFSTIAVGLVSWWVVPGAGLAAGLALGAVVAPPDAVAATTVARRVGMPRRIVSILEGESLVNDGTALVALNTAAAAITASVTPVDVGWDIVRSAGGGVIIGLVVAFVLAKVRRYITDPVLDTTLSFAAPYLAFLPAEEIKASGVLAVVVTGLVLGHKAPVLQTASSRIAENINWRTVQFLLENTVFLLIGLQLRRLLHNVAGTVSATSLGWSRVIVVCLVVLAATILARIAWMILVGVTMRVFRLHTWEWTTSAVISWAGMRGVVTLAAVFLLPEATPSRSLLALAAFVVVAGTLLIQGLTLPWLVRRLKLPRPDPAEDALQAAGLVTAAAQAGLAALDQIRDDNDPDEVLQALRSRAEVRSNSVWEQLGRPQAELEPPSVAYRRLRVQMLAAERSSILEARDRGIYDDEVLRQSLQSIDLEESLLDRVEDAANTVVEHELTTSDQRAGQCEHLREAPRTIRAETPEGCPECIAEGLRWVHLRLCLTCGHVGCCDSSVGRHAEKHFHETEHPVMRSIEPGEAWRWCYVDELLG